MSSNFFSRMFASVKGMKEEDIPDPKPQQLTTPKLRYNRYNAMYRKTNEKGERTTGFTHKAWKKRKKRLQMTKHSRRMNRAK